MRFFEFSGDDYATKLVMILRNYIGRASSKKAPSKLNWAGLDRILKSSGAEMTADYETFKSIYDASPTVQAMVKNFSDDGLELNVPGAPQSADEKEPTQGTGKTSQDAVDQMAASAAPQQLAAQA